MEENDWGYIEKLKSEKDAQIIENERKKVKQGKKVYKKELDGFKFLKDLQKEEERKAKEKEAMKVSEEAKNFELEQRLKKEKELKRQAELSEMLDNHKEIQKMTKET